MRKKIVLKTALIATLLIATALGTTIVKSAESREVVEKPYHNNASPTSPTIGAIVRLGYMRTGIMRATAYAEVKPFLVEVGGGTLIKILVFATVEDLRPKRLAPYSVYFSVSPGREARVIVPPAINKTFTRALIPLLGGFIKAPWKEGTYYYTVTAIVSGPHASASDSGTVIVVVNNSEGSSSEPSMSKGSDTVREPNKQVGNHPIPAGEREKHQQKMQRWNRSTIY